MAGRIFLAPEASGRRSGALRRRNPEQCQLHHLDKKCPPRRREPGRRPVARPRRMAHHRQARRARKTSPRSSLPSRAPELNPVENIWQFLRRKLGSQTSSSKPTTTWSKLHLRHLLAQTHRPARNHHAQARACDECAHSDVRPRNSGRESEKSLLDRKGLCLVDFWRRRATNQNSRVGWFFLPKSRS